MRLKIFLTPILIIALFVSAFSQDNLKVNENNFTLTGLNAAPVSHISLGGGLGPAFIVDGSSGLTFNFFAEIKTESFSIVPQVNYWKASDQNNFEVAGLLRLRFQTPTIEPYIDGGIGVNVVSQKINNVTENLTKAGLDIGGGVTFPGIGPKLSLYVDGKYKIIISDPNLSGYFITGGIKLDL